MAPRGKIFYLDLIHADPTEMETGSSTDVAIGPHGRGKRDRDAGELRVTHIEDNRGKAPAKPSTTTS